LAETHAWCLCGSDRAIGPTGGDDTGASLVPEGMAVMHGYLNVRDGRLGFGAAVTGQGKSGGCQAAARWLARCRASMATDRAACRPMTSNNVGCTTVVQSPLRPGHAARRTSVAARPRRAVTSIEPSVLGSQLKRAVPVGSWSGAAAGTQVARMGWVGRGGTERTSTPRMDGGIGRRTRSPRTNCGEVAAGYAGGWSLTRPPSPAGYGRRVAGRQPGRSRRCRRRRSHRRSR
jgi:hypothetical protein